MRYGVGHRCGSDPPLLWLWCRPAAAAPFRPQPGNFHMLQVQPQKDKKKKKKKERKKERKKNPKNKNKVSPRGGTRFRPQGVAQIWTWRYSEKVFHSQRRAQTEAWKQQRIMPNGGQGILSCRD